MEQNIGSFRKIESFQIFGISVVYMYYLIIIYRIFHQTIVQFSKNTSFNNI